MSNRTSLAQLAGMPQEEVRALPLAHVAMLLEDIETESDRLKRLKALLDGELHHRFADAAAKARKMSGKDTGTVTLMSEADGYKVRADLPKKVEWDQKKLGRAVETIKSWAENPADYVALEIKVSEAKFAAWPPAIRKLFEPARTVSVGKPSYKLEAATQEAA